MKKWWKPNWWDVKSNRVLMGATVMELPTEDMTTATLQPIEETMPPVDQVELEAATNYILSLIEHKLIGGNDIPAMFRFRYDRNMKPHVRVMTGCELHLYRKRRAA